MSLTMLTGASLKDVAQELARMTRGGIASTHVRRLAEQAGASTNSILKFVQQTFPYIPDPYSMELFISPNRMAVDYFQGRSRGGDCDDLAMLTAAMMGSVGYETRLVLVATQGLEVDHAIAQVKSPVLGWLDVDAASRNPLGWYVNGGRISVNL